MMLTSAKLFLATVCGCVLSHFSRARLFVTLWTVAHQIPLSMRFSGPEFWSGLPCPPPGGLPSLGTEPSSHVSPALAGMLFTTEPPGKPRHTLLFAKRIYAVSLDVIPAALFSLYSKT